MKYSASFPRRFFPLLRIPARSTFRGSKKSVRNIPSFAKRNRRDSKNNVKWPRRRINRRILFDFINNFLLWQDKIGKINKQHCVYQLLQYSVCYVPKSRYNRVHCCILCAFSTQPTFSTKQTETTTICLFFEYLSSCVVVLETRNKSTIGYKSRSKVKTFDENNSETIERAFPANHNSSIVYVIIVEKNDMRTYNVK